MPGFDQNLRTVAAVRRTPEQLWVTFTNHRGIVLDSSIEEGAIREGDKLWVDTENDRVWRVVSEKGDRVFPLPQHSR